MPINYTFYYDAEIDRSINSNLIDCADKFYDILNYGKIYHTSFYAERSEHFTAVLKHVEFETDYNIDKTKLELSFTGTADIDNVNDKNALAKELRSLVEKAIKETIEDVNEQLSTDRFTRNIPKDEFLSIADNHWFIRVDGATGTSISYEPLTFSTEPDKYKINDIIEDIMDDIQH